MSGSEQDEGVPFDIDDIAGAERLAGVKFTAAERQLLLRRSQEQLGGYAHARQDLLPNSLEPALRFDPRPPMPPRQPVLPPLTAPSLSHERLTEEELSFLPVHRLGQLLRAGSVTSAELTRISLDRLRRIGPRLRCLVTLTEELALKQAYRADQELASGVDRGALHGIPYGVKDLLAVPGYSTTWGAAPFREQRFDETATVVERLDAAGAVLVAKLSLGELAMGDVWFGGKTLDPWDPTRGSSGSSAGSASAVAAGLVPFAIGSETMGSIVSPATRCAVVGLRPSVGRVSRHGAMALAWSLDKLGPIARSVEDCALVLQAIAGPDGLDGSLVDLDFSWDADTPVQGLRVGYVEEAFAEEGSLGERFRGVLGSLREGGLELVPMELPSFAPEPIMTALMVEAATAFDELTRSGADDQLAQQGQSSWPNLLRAARLVPAVEYLQANRLRTLAVREMASLFEGVDAYLCPSSFHSNLFLTNATGNPAVVVPIFEEERRPLPASLTVTGPLYGELQALLVALRLERELGPRPVPNLSDLAA